MKTLLKLMMWNKCDASDQASIFHGSVVWFWCSCAFYGTFSVRLSISMDTVTHPQQTAMPRLFWHLAEPEQALTSSLHCATARFLTHLSSQATHSDLMLALIWLIRWKVGSDYVRSHLTWTVGGSILVGPGRGGTRPSVCAKGALALEAFSFLWSAVFFQPVSLAASPDSPTPGAGNTWTNINFEDTLLNWCLIERSCSYSLHINA